MDNISIKEIKMKKDLYAKAKKRIENEKNKKIC